MDAAHVASRVEGSSDPLQLLPQVAPAPSGEKTTAEKRFCTAADKAATGPCPTWVVSGGRTTTCERGRLWGHRAGGHEGAASRGSAGEAAAPTTSSRVLDAASATEYSRAGARDDCVHLLTHGASARASMSAVVDSLETRERGADRSPRPDGASAAPSAEGWNDDDAEVRGGPGSRGPRATADIRYCPRSTGSEGRGRSSVDTDARRDVGVRRGRVVDDEDEQPSDGLRGEAEVEPGERARGHSLGDACRASDRARGERQDGKEAAQRRTAPQGFVPQISLRKPLRQLADRSRREAFMVVVSANGVDGHGQPRATTRFPLSWPASGAYPRIPR